MAIYTVGSDGVSLVWQGQLSFVNAADVLQTGVATLTATPSGGISNLPAIVDGDPGLPPVLTFATPTPLTPGSSPTMSSTLTSPGGAGTASAYTVTLGIPTGATGAAGTNGTISGASDLSGSLVNGDTLYYNSSTSKWVVSQPIFTQGPFITLNSSFAADYSGSAGTFQVATVGLPSLPWPYYPVVSAGLYVSGTINTHVDLVARLNNATSGQQIGYGLGQTGAGPFPVTIGASFGAALTGTYGQVSANTTATVYLVATQINSTTDAWQTINTNGYLSVLAVPV